MRLFPWFSNNPPTISQFDILMPPGIEFVLVSGDKCFDELEEILRHDGRSVQLINATGMLPRMWPGSIVLRGCVWCGGPSASRAGGAMSFFNLSLVSTTNREPGRVSGGRLRNDELGNAVGTHERRCGSSGGAHR